MRSKLVKILFATVAAFVALCTQAVTETVNGVEWKYMVTGEGTAVIESGELGVSAINQSTSGVIMIPSTLGGCPVVEIGDYAFYYCGLLTSVTIPNSVTNIGDCTFYSCRSLTSVVIPNSVTSIGAYAFQFCYSLTSVTIPNNVMSIGDRAFSGCSLLASVMIPDSVTSIGDYTFMDCSSLTGVTIGNSVMDIGERAFHGCSLLEKIVVTSGNTYYKSVDGLLFSRDGNEIIACPEGKTDVTIPDSVTSIGDYAFYYCGLLTSVTIPNSVTNIGDYAFMDCSSLTSVTIPNSVASIGDYAFAYCNNLTSLVYEGDESFIEFGEDVFSGTIFEPFELIIDENGILMGFTGACPTNVVIPEGVVSIGESAFDADYNDVWGLISVSIPSTVTNISDYAFYACESLESVTIPASVASIGTGTFAFCYNLETVEFKGNMDAIDMDVSLAFRATAWFSITFGPTNDKYENAQVLESVDSGSVAGTLLGATIADNDCIWQYGDAERTVWYKWVAPTTGVVNFLATADNDRSDLLYLVATRGYDSENDEWDDCGYDWGNGVIFNVLEGETYYISLATWNYVVDGFKLSWQLSLPPSNDAFSAATELTEVSGSVEGLNIRASKEEFEDDLGFGTSTVWWKWTAPSSSLMQFDTFGSEFDTMLGIYILDDGTFTEVAFNDDDEDGESEYGESRVKFNVNAGTTYYIGVSGYSDNQGYILLNWDWLPEFVYSVSDDGVTIIEYNGSGSEVVIPATIEGKPVVSIGAEAFYECASLRSVTIPSSVTNIGDYAFYNCENLTDVVWEGDVLSIEFGSEVFDGTQYEIPEQFELLIDEENVLIGFTGTCPANVVIPDGVAEIAESAFICWNNDIDNLESVTIPSSVTNIGNYAFYGCYNLFEIIFEGEMSSVDFGYGVFFGTSYNENSPFTLLINKDNVLDGFIGPCPVNLVIPDGVVEIGEFAFSAAYDNVENLESVTIPASVTNICYCAFGWVNLTYAKVPEALKSQVEEGNVFVGCSPDLQIEYYRAASLVEPVISPMNGTEFYGDSCTVTISCMTEGASIYYIVCDTNNVTNPRPSDRNLYTGPFTVSATKMVRAFSMLDSKTSDVVSAMFIKRELALPIAVDATNLVFTTGGDAQWTLVSDISAKIGDSFAQSGKLTWSEEDWEPSETWMETTVTGEGVFSFWWKTDCEDDPWGATWDRLMVFTNGVEAARIDGKTEWEQLTFSFNDISSHTIRWVFCKDDWDDEKLTDLAWVDGVVWTPASMDVAIDVGGGKNVIVPVSWIDQYDSIVTAVGGDKAAALMLTAANGRKVWECFMLGVDPTKADDDFKITRFWMENGKPKFEFSHSTDGAGNSFLSRLKIKGKARLSDGWTDVPPDGDSAYQFFTVEVSLP